MSNIYTYRVRQVYPADEDYRTTQAGYFILERSTNPAVTWVPATPLVFQNLTDAQNSAQHLINDEQNYQNAVVNNKHLAAATRTVLWPT